MPCRLAGIRRPILPDDSCPFLPVRPRSAVGVSLRPGFPFLHFSFPWLLCRPSVLAFPHYACWGPYCYLFPFLRLPGWSPFSLLAFSSWSLLLCSPIWVRVSFLGSSSPSLGSTGRGSSVRVPFAPPSIRRILASLPRSSICHIFL